MNDSELDQLFAELKTQAAEPSSDLMARVLGDAAQVQGKDHGCGAHAPPKSKPAHRFWARWDDLFTGWPVWAGMAATVAAGVWIGFYPPQAVGRYVAVNTDEITVSEGNDEVADYVIDLASDGVYGFSEETL